MKKAYIVSNNYCEEAKLETQRLINIICKASAPSEYVYTNKIEDADLIVFYSCGHLQTTEADSINTIKRILSQKKASSELIVWGCLPKINPEAIRRVHSGPMVGPEDWAFFYKLFDQPEEIADSVTANALSFGYGLPSANERLPSRVRARFWRFLLYFDLKPKRIWYIRTESGCVNSCTYCSDKLAYFCVRSQPIESIIQQFGRGLRNGYKYFFFVGRDQGSYGCDIGLSLADLLQAIHEKYPDQDYKLILDHVSPNKLIDLYPNLNSSILFNNVCELGSHIQSGSDRILKLMGKNVKVYDWTRVIKTISRDYPQIRLQTSMIVGFPSESEQDFRQSINLVNNVLFDKIFVYTFNERPGLPALRIKGRVPEKTKRKRERTMNYYATINMYRKRISRNLQRA